MTMKRPLSQDKLRNVFYFNLFNKLNIYKLVRII